MFSKLVEVEYLNTILQFQYTFLIHNTEKGMFRKYFKEENKADYNSNISSELSNHIGENIHQPSS